MDKTVELDVKSTNEKVELSIAEIRTLCECLYDFKQNIDNLDEDNVTVYHKQRRLLKSKEVENLFNKLEHLAHYKSGSFKKALEACLNKKDIKVDVGEDAFNLTNSKFYKK